MLTRTKLSTPYTFFGDLKCSLHNIEIRSIDPCKASVFLYPTEPLRRRSAVVDGYSHELLMDINGRRIEKSLLNPE